MFIAEALEAQCKSGPCQLVSICPFAELLTVVPGCRHDALTADSERPGDELSNLFVDRLLDLKNQMLGKRKS